VDSRLGTTSHPPPGPGRSTGRCSGPTASAGPPDAVSRCLAGYRCVRRPQARIRRPRQRRRGRQPDEQFESAARHREGTRPSCQPPGRGEPLIAALDRHVVGCNRASNTYRTRHHHLFRQRQPVRACPVDDDRLIRRSSRPAGRRTPRTWRRRTRRQSRTALRSPRKRSGRPAMQGREPVSPARRRAGRSHRLPERRI
jgi:hypothetical protein